jgi:hypothetical protein
MQAYAGRALHILVSHILHGMLLALQQDTAFSSRTVPAAAYADDTSWRSCKAQIGRFAMRAGGVNV